MPTTVAAPVIPPRLLPVIGETRTDEPWGDERPRTRGECEGRPRPCPWVSCRYNLLLDVTDVGSIMLNAGRTTSEEPVQEGRRQRPRNLTRRIGVLRPKAASHVVEEFADQVVAELEAPGRPSCVLDLVDDNCSGMTLEATGDIMAITRERVRQLEEMVFLKLRSGETADLLEQAEDLDRCTDPLEAAGLV